MRLFVAIEIPQAIREALGALGRDLKQDLGAESRAMRWVRPEGIHLTLKFLGEMQEADLPALARALDRAIPASVAPFEVEVSGLGTFPARGRPRVLWVGLHERSGRLATLQQRVEAAIAAAGVPGVKEENRPFSPHLTLARFGEGRPPAALPAALERRRDTAIGSFPVEAVVLFQSILNPGGAEYRRVQEHRL